MTSSRQIESNRRNALQSTGPKTENGKRQSRRNALRHGLAAETVIEGRVCGKHSSEFLGFPPTERDVELPFVAFYRFDPNGKLISERVVMNLGPLRG